MPHTSVDVPRMQISAFMEALMSSLNCVACNLHTCAWGGALRRWKLLRRWRSLEMGFLTVSTLPPPLARLVMQP